MLRRLKRATLVLISPHPLECRAIPFLVTGRIPPRSPRDSQDFGAAPRSRTGTFRFSAGRTDYLYESGE